MDKFLNIGEKSYPLKFPLYKTHTFAEINTDCGERKWTNQ